MCFVSWVFTAAYVVRREGNVLTRVCPSVCPQGGYPYPIMLCNITQNAMGQTPRQGGGYPYPIILCNITQNSIGQTPGGIPCQVQLRGVPCQGVPCSGGTWVGYSWPGQDGGYPAWGGTQVGYPPGQVRMAGTLPRGYPAWGVPR